MRDNLSDDQHLSKRRGGLPPGNPKLAALGIQLRAGLLLESGNGEKPPTAEVSERQV
jgi:hypothetical protein